MNDDVLIRNLSPDDGWDCAISVLEDCYPMLPKTDKGYAVRDLIRIEQQRRAAFKRRGAADSLAGLGVSPSEKKT